jgi:hypothetical protein
MLAYRIRDGLRSVKTADDIGGVFERAALDIPALLLARAIDRIG